MPKGLPLAIGLATLLGLALLPDPAKAWGKFGHLVVCDLAYRNLTDASKDELKELFNGKRGITVKGKGELADRHYTSFNVGCLEEDEMPRKHPDDHFINVSRDTKSIDGEACPNNNTCILAGIERDLATLKNQAAAKQDRVFALMAIGHWIGDIHQPLHISFADDRGGNSIDVKLKGRCGGSSYRVANLHGMWDNCLLEAGLFERVRKRSDFKKTWSKNTITYRAVDTLQAQTSLAEEKSFVGAKPWEWAAESIRHHAHSGRALLRAGRIDVPIFPDDRDAAGQEIEAAGPARSGIPDALRAHRGGKSEESGISPGPSAEPCARSELHRADPELHAEAVADPAGMRGAAARRGGQAGLHRDHGRR